MKKSIGILGSSSVAQALSKGFDAEGYKVMISSRTPDKIQPEGNIQKGTFKEATQFGEILVLAVKGEHVGNAIQLAGSANFKGKTVIDATNPIANEAPEDGVLKFFTDQNSSLLENLQSQFPDANFVKAFSCIGSPFMYKPNFQDGRPTMFIAGNDGVAKKEVIEIVELFGFETADMGTAKAARAIEPLCMLWCIPGMLTNSWTHAFKLLRK